MARGGEILRDVGPTDVDSAGELVKSVGVRHQGRRLIQAVARSKPAAVVAQQARPEDIFRTQFLDADEVEKAAENAFGDDVVEVLSARVRGKGAEPESQSVVILFETESGRTARGVLAYGNLSDSQSAFDKAVKEGAFNPYVDDQDIKAVREELAKARAEVRRLRGLVAGGQRGGVRAESTVDTAALSQEESDATVKKLLPYLSNEGIREILNSDPSDAVQKAAQDELEERATAAEAEAAGGGNFNAEATVDGTVTEVLPRLENLSPEELDAVEAAEKDGKKRTSVLDAVKAKRG